MVSAAAGRGDSELRALIVAQTQCSVGDGKMGAVKASVEMLFSYVRLLLRPLSADDTEKQSV